VSHHASIPSISAVPSRSDPPSRRVSVAGEASNTFAEFVTMDRNRETASKPESSHAGAGSADRRNAGRELRRSADELAPARRAPGSDRTVAHDSIPQSPDASDRAAATRGPDDAETSRMPRRRPPWPRRQPVLQPPLVRPASPAVRPNRMRSDVVDGVDLTQWPPLLSVGGQTFTLDRIKQVRRSGT